MGSTWVSANKYLSILYYPINVNIAVTYIFLELLEPFIDLLALWNSINLLLIAFTWSYVKSKSRYLFSLIMFVPTKNRQIANWLLSCLLLLLHILFVLCLLNQPLRKLRFSILKKKRINVFIYINEHISSRL